MPETLLYGVTTPLRVKSIYSVAEGLKIKRYPKGRIMFHVEGFNILIVAPILVIDPLLFPYSV